MNQTVLIGRLTDNIEVRTTTNGVPVGSFTLAVQRNYKNKNTGEYDTDFIRCIAFNKTAEVLQQYTQKGSRIGVVGSIQTGSYQAQDGSTRYTTEVIVNQFEFLDTRQDQQSNQPSQDVVNQADNYFDSNSAFDIDDSDLPF